MKIKVTTVEEVEYELPLYKQSSQYYMCLIEDEKITTVNSQKDRASIDIFKGIYHEGIANNWIHEKDTTKAAFDNLFQNALTNIYQQLTPIADEGAESSEEMRGNEFGEFEI